MDGGRCMGREGVEKYRGTGNWYRAYDELARAEMFTNNYLQAAEQWSKLRGNTADFYVAFCYYMAGEYSKAIQAFEENLPRSREWRVATLYWKSKSHRKLGQIDSAQEAENQILSEDEQGWYSLLLRQSEIFPDRDQSRAGIWPDSRVISPPRYETGYSLLNPKPASSTERPVSSKTQGF